MRKRLLTARAVSKFCMVGSFSSCSDVQLFQEERPCPSDLSWRSLGQDFLIRRNMTVVSHACRLTE
jgi:hypothetical protein